MSEYVLNALYPDGTRGVAMLTQDHGWRRKASGSRLWVYGQIKTRPNDVRFIDGPQPVYEPPQVTNEPSLEADLASDPAFRAALRDDRFAMAACKVSADVLSSSVMNPSFEKGWYHRDEPTDRWRPVLTSNLVELIVGVRRLGESREDYKDCWQFPGVLPSRWDDQTVMLQSHIDYAVDQRPRAEGKIYSTDVRSEQYQHSVEQLLRELRQNADVFAELEGFLVKHGWRPVSRAERLQALKDYLAPSVSLLHDIRRFEAREDGPLAPWAEEIRERNQSYRQQEKERLQGRSRIPEQVPLLHPLTLEKLSKDEREANKTHFLARLLDLAMAGRISKEEYQNLLPRVEQAASRVRNRYWLPFDPDDW